MPKILPISIIIPTLNEEKYLAHLLYSLQKQSHQPAEIIIADANSTDRTREIAKKFGCKIVDGGTPSIGRNNGAKIASQNLLLFLDADVILPQFFLYDTVKEIQDRHLDIASCYIRPQSLKQSDKVVVSLWNSYFQITEIIAPHACGFCIFVKKDLHNTVKGFNKKIILGEDINYVQKASKKGKFRFLHSQKILVSTRRFVKEGALKTSLKYIAIELHSLLLGGVKKDIYKYEFGKFSDDSLPKRSSI